MSKPEFSKKWWASEKPADIKGVELDKALQAVEKALADEKKKGDAESINAVFPALEDLETAVDKTLKKECDKKKHKDLMTTLDKFYGLIKDENSRLEDAKEKLESSGDKDDKDEEDEEEDKGKMFTADYVHKMMKLVKNGKELRFCFALNKSNPENSELLLRRKGNPEALLKIMKREMKGEITPKNMTFGAASVDPDNPLTLVFKLESSANEPPQIIKKVRRFLKSDRKLKFKKVRLVLPGGQAIEDTEPDAAGEGGGGSNDQLVARLRAATAAADIWQKSHDNVTAQVDQLRGKLDGFDDPDVKKIKDGLGTLFNRYPKLDFAALTGAADQAAFDKSLATTRQGLDQWQKLLAGDSALRTIDENPFASTTVVGTLNDALGRITTSLQV